MNNPGHSRLATAHVGRTGQPPLVPNGSRGSGDGSALDLLLRNVISNIQPSLDDHEKRSRTLTKITQVLQYLRPLRGASIKPFGSFVSNLYTRWGDLDISIELPANGQGSLKGGNKMKRDLLNNIKQFLISRGVTRSVEFVKFARVPLLIFEDSESQISCDISINNGSGLFKSKLLYWISQIDARCRELVYLIKYWAKAHEINDPKNGTLNSFSLTLLVIFHLQTQYPPILPPIKDIFDGDCASVLAGGKGTNEMEIENKCIWNIQKFKQQASTNENKSSISDLFISFFSLYATLAEEWKGLTVCTFTGKWGNTSSREYWITKKYAIVIEDPFDRKENCARTVTESTLKIISDEFVQTDHLLQRFPLFSNMYSLHQSLFGSPHERTRPYVLPFQEIVAKTSRKIDEDDTNDGFMQPSQTTYSLTIRRNRPTLADKPLDSLSAAFNQGCSLDERSMLGKPTVLSTSSSIHRHQAQPSFTNSASHNLRRQHYPSERMQQTPEMHFMAALPSGKIWKPKSHSQGI